MKVSIILGGLAVVSLCVFGHLCVGNVFSTAQAQDQASKSLELQVTGMTCTACAKHIQSALSKKEGILESNVQYPDGKAVVKFKAEEISEKEIIETIEKAGYKAEKKDEQGTKKTSSAKRNKGSCC